MVPEYFPFSRSSSKRDVFNLEVEGGWHNPPPLSDESVEGAGGFARRGGVSAGLALLGRLMEGLIDDREEFSFAFCRCLYLVDFPSPNPPLIRQCRLA